MDVALEGGGNLYIADANNCRVRKVSGGTITTVAGNGTCGYGGDGGAATSANLTDPRSVALDGGGNLYIADTYNCRVRKVSGGTITTVAGDGTCAYSGDGGLATSASLYNPYGVAVDGGGNLYIADTYNCRVRKVSGGTITTVAGDGTCAYSGDGGPATSARLYEPSSMELDGGGNLYIADTYNNRIRKVAFAASVGGVAEQPDLAGLPSRSAAASGGSRAAQVRGGVLVAALAIALAGRWAVRRGRRVV